MIIVTWVTLVLGIVNVTKSAVSLMEDVQVSPDVLFGSATALALVITVIITIHILLKRKREIQKMLQQSQQEK
jgi:sensor domain CHASE-containing protein